MAANSKKNTEFRLKAQGSLLTLFSIGLTGCGLSNTSSTTSGTAIKGLLEGAEVFIDTDGDGVWTEGVDSAKDTTDADGNFSIQTDLTGDIVVQTNSNTIDKSSGQVLDGVTLSAPQGYDVVSVATTITNELMDSSAAGGGTALTAEEAEAQVKSMLGINEDVNIANYNPFDTANAGTAESVAYEKVAQQVMTVINTLAVAEENFDSNVDRGAALDNAFEAFVEVMEDNVAAATTNQTTITAIDFTSSSTLVGDVIGKYDSTSALQDTTNNGAAIAAIETAVEAVNDAIDSVTDLDSGKELFAVAQATLVDSAAAVANTGDAQLMAIDANTDLSALLVVSGGRGAIEENNEGGLTASGTLAVKDPDTEDTVTYEFDTTAVFQGTGSSVGVLDVEADGTWTYTITGNPATIDGMDDGETYTETFKVNVFAVDSSDSSSSTATEALVTVTINGQNDAPVIVEAEVAPVTQAEDEAVEAGLTATDFFTDAEGDALTFTATLNGEALPDSLTVAEDGAISGSLGNDEVGVNELAITATDSAGNETTATIEITVTNVNDDPTSTAIADGAVDEDSAYSVDVSSHFADVDAGDSLTYTMTGAPSSLTIDTATGIISGTPLNADTGTKSITVTATDSANASTSQTFDLVITNINDAPEGGVTITGKNSEEETLTADTSTLADDDGLGTLSYVWMRDGTAIDGATASTYTLTRDDIGTQVTVEVTYTDGSGNAESLTSAPTNTVTEINHPATGDLVITGTAADNSTLTLDTTAIADQNGIDSDFTITWKRDDVAIADSNATTLTLTDADVGAIITASATFTDGLGATETVTTAVGTSAVVDVNDAPTSTAIAAADATEDTVFSLDVSDSFDDVDAGDTLTFTATGLPGDLAMAANGTISGTPVNADVGDHTITVTAKDGDNETTTQTFTLSVANTNDTPVVASNAPTTQTFAEDTAVNMDISQYFSDPDGDGLTFTSNIPSDSGLSMSEAGVISGTPTQADVGNSTITITAADTSGETVSANVDVTITNTNDDPTGSLEIGGVNSVGGTLYAVELITDEDGYTEELTAVNGYTWYRDGTAIAGATSDEYTLTADDAGTTITLGYTYTDALGGSNTVTSAYGVDVGNAQTLPAQETTGKFIVSTSDTNGVITVEVYADTTFAPIADGLGAFDATINFDTAGATYVASSFSMGIAGTGIPNETDVANGVLTVGHFAYPAITDLSTPLFSFQLQDQDSTSGFELTASGSMGLDGSSKGDTGETLVNVGHTGGDNITFSYGGKDYAFVVDAMTYADATAYATSNGNQLASIDSFGNDFGLDDAFAYLTGDIVDLFGLAATETQIGGVEHLWIDSANHQAVQLVDSTSQTEDNSYFTTATVTDTTEELFFIVEIV